MSGTDLVDHWRAEADKNKTQAIRRKEEINRLNAELADVKKQLETANKEREKAAKEVEEIKAAYEEFTNENRILQELETLRAENRLRDLHDAFNGVDGVEYQDGVTLDDILQAAKLNPDEIDEITPEFVTKAIEAARASKPFLFAAQAQAQGDAANTGDVRQVADPAAPTLKAFGAQAAGGGSAPKPKPEIDYSDPVAVLRQAKAVAAGGTA